VTWYEFFLFVHITAAVIWLGGAFTFQMYGAVVRRGGDPGEIAVFAGRAGHLSERMFVPASLTVILAGIALMINGNWDWDQLWVIFALVIFAASFLTGVLVISPMAKRIPDAGPTTPAGQALIERLFTILRIDLCFMYAIVFAMVVKPTTGRRLDDRDRGGVADRPDPRLPEAALAQASRSTSSAPPAT
jgi:uncharacterized membrane protein